MKYLVSQKDLTKKLRNPFDAPAFNSDCWPRCSPNRINKQYPLSEKLLYRSHIPIDFPFELDMEEVNKEISAMGKDGWCPFDNDPLRERGAGVSNYWTGKFIRNLTEDHTYGFADSKALLEIMDRHDDIEDGHCKREKLVKTDIWDQTSYLRYIANHFVTIEKCNRILVARVDPNSRVNWHSHVKETESFYYAYLHIPLITDENVQMLVCKDGAIEYEHYGPNTAWIFNTQHNHAVNTKNSESFRYHLLIIASFDDEKFVNIVEHSLEKYKEYKPNRLIL